MFSMGIVTSFRTSVPHALQFPTAPDYEIPMIYNNIFSAVLHAAIHYLCLELSIATVLITMYY